MQKKIVIFTQICPYPDKFGYLRRVISIVRGFSDLGCKIYLFGFNENRFSPWTNDNISYLKSNWVNEVLLYDSKDIDYWFRRILEFGYSKLRHSKIPYFSRFRTPLLSRLWFTQQVDKIRPDLIMMNYAYNDGVLDHAHFKNTRRAIDTIDLHSLNQSMQASLQKYIPSTPIQPKLVDEIILQENYFENLPLEVDKKEFQVFDRYSDTIAISQTESDIIQNNTQKTRVSYIPMMIETQNIDNQYSGPALFPTGPNLFNTQGYLYFVRRVLPLIRSKQNDFLLQVTGFLDQTQIIPEPGVEILGFVPDLVKLFKQAKFVISPVFGGTGQQIKIIEAMAYGLPVITLRSAAERSPLIHGVNGLIADNAEEFAESVCKLWSDRPLCQKLGTAARQTIAENFSQEQLVNKLSCLLP